MSTTETEKLNGFTPEEHYNRGMNSLNDANDPSQVADGSMERMNLLLNAMAHFLGAATRDGLDYSERQRERELAEAEKSGYGASERGVRIEEEDDDDRP